MIYPKSQFYVLLGDMAVLTFHDPSIAQVPGVGFQVVAKCRSPTWEENFTFPTPEKSLILSRQVSTVNMTDREILIFLEGGSIVQLVNLRDIQATYDLIVAALAP